MNGGRRHATIAQYAGGFVGGGKNGQRALIFLFLAFIIAGDNLYPGLFQGLVELSQQKRLSRPRLAHNRHDLAFAIMGRHEQ